MRRFLLFVVLLFLPILAQARFIPGYEPPAVHSRRDILQGNAFSSSSSSSSSSSLSSAPTAMTWSNASAGFQVTIPKGWKAQEDRTTLKNAKRVLLVTDPSTNDAMSVVIETPAPRNLETYFATAVWWLKESFTAFLPVDADTTTLAGKKAMTLTFTAGPDATPSKVREVYAIDGGRTLILALWASAATYAQSSPIFDQFLASFTLTGATGK